MINVKYEGGVLSGWKLTSIIDSLINLLYLKLFEYVNGESIRIKLV
jgi:hypothetical protein